MQALSDERFASLDAHVATQFQNVEGQITRRFQDIDAHFALIERQRVEQKQDTKAAVESALAAAKEAVKEQTIASDRAITKSETATSEQLKQLSTTFTTAIAAVGGSIGEAKERITGLESIRIGGKENLSGVYALIGVLITIALLVLGVMSYLNR